MSLDNIGVEHPDDIRMTDPGQHDGLAESFFNIWKCHARGLEDLHGLPSEKTVFYTEDLGEGSFTKESFDLIGIADILTFCEYCHGCSVAGSADPFEFAVECVNVSVVIIHQGLNLAVHGVEQVYLPIESVH